MSSSLLSVQADNAYVTQVQKQPPSFSNMVWQNTGVSLDDNAAFHHSATLNGAITVAPDGSPSGTVTVAFDDGSTAVISQIPTGQTLISTGLITLDLRTPDGGGDSAVVCVTKGDSSAVSLEWYWSNRYERRRPMVQPPVPCPARASNACARHALENVAVESECASRHGRQRV